MQIRRGTVALMSVLLAGGILSITLCIEIARRPNFEIANGSDLADGISTSRAASLAGVSGTLPPQSNTLLAPVVVSYRQGYLAIEARSATLRDVLSAVTQATGVTFAADDDTRQAVTLTIGPAPLQQAIADLVHRVGYGYALTGADPGNEGSAALRVFLLRQGVGDGRSQISTGSRLPMAAPDPVPESEAQPTTPEAAAVRQKNRFIEQFMEACNEQACGAS